MCTYMHMRARICICRHTCARHTLCMPLDQVAAAQLCVTVPTETLDALTGVTDELLLAVLGQSITYMQGLAVDEEGELAEELDEKINGHFEAPAGAIDKVVSNEKFLEMR